MRTSCWRRHLHLLPAAASTFQGQSCSGGGHASGRRRRLATWRTLQRIRSGQGATGRGKHTTTAGNAQIQPGLLCRSFWPLLSATWCTLQRRRSGPTATGAAVRPLHPFRIPRFRSCSCRVAHQPALQSLCWLPAAAQMSNLTRRTAPDRVIGCARSCRFEASLYTAALRGLWDHAVNGRPLLPAAAMLEVGLLTSCCLLRRCKPTP